MNKEIIKSVILTFLVVLSTALTWNIWTYSPDIQKSDQTPFLDIAISKEQQIENIIKPFQMIYHGEDQLYGSIVEEDINQVMQKIKAWTFYGFKDVSENIPSRDWKTFMQKPGMCELIFSDSIPLTIYKQVIKIEDREIPDLEFDRMFIKSSKEEKENQVFLVSSTKKRVYKFSVDYLHLNAFTEFMGETAGKMDSYTQVKVSENKYLYVPNQETKISKYKRYPELIDRERFKDALFPDPSSVKQEYTARGEEYTDGSSLMNVFIDTFKLNYINPGRNKNQSIVPSELLKKSIEFINEHSGWEDNYRFTELDEKQQKTTFRLFVSGLPVFNDDGMSEIVQIWSEGEILMYNRPFFTLDTPLTFEIETVTLPSGEDAFNEIKQMSGYKPDLLENMSIGYKMFKDQEEPQLLALEPAWFYKYGGKWKQLNPEKPGGMIDGLE